MDSALDPGTGVGAALVLAAADGASAALERRPRKGFRGAHWRLVSTEVCVGDSILSARETTAQLLTASLTAIFLEQVQKVLQHGDHVVRERIVVEVHKIVANLGNLL